MSVCTTQILPSVVAQKSRSAKEKTDEAMETPSLQSLSSSKSVATLPLVVPQGQVVQLSPEPSSDELYVPSGHTAQSEEAEAQ